MTEPETRIKALEDARDAGAAWRTFRISSDLEARITKLEGDVLANTNDINRVLKILAKMK